MGHVLLRHDSLLKKTLKVEWKQGRPKAPRRRKMRHRNHRGTKIRKLGGQSSKFKFGQLILRKIIKIVATRCYILKVKCTKFDFGWGSTGGAYSAPQTPKLDLRSPASKGRGREGKRGKGGRGKRGKGMGGCINSQLHGREENW